MENRDFYEILSPVGDMETFYTAIKSGANAVYMGLPKFNARMRAENINLDNLSKLVSFAHLKNVQVYITLNTILKDSEIKEAIELVGICLSSGVDAFIVQDFGLVYALKSVYPDIVLHGSTQMGVHNVRGAKVAKELGLSRVVLSREVTLSDIEDIANNVDIELEVFIQGAMCVCFSGNCYISSIKHNASGNRGECKQLCRLPYTLTDGKNTKKGYMISPRDNSMIDYLDKLMELGVKSYKIEGRLRHSGYVRVCTSTYASAMNDILEQKEINKEKLKKNLSRVFARGEYISGYFNGNDIINKDINNHLGEYIGEVVSSSKFKDIFKITLKLNRNIVQNDGLKFVLSNNDIITLGVGNIEYNGNNIIVYGKNYIPAKSKVYLSLDSKFESSYIDIDTKIKLKMAFEGYIGNRCSLRITYNDIDITEHGEVCQSPKSKPITRDNVVNQLSKIDKSVFEIENIDIDMEEVFLPLSAINELRRVDIY